MVANISHDSEHMCRQVWEMHIGNLRSATSEDVPWKWALNGDSNQPTHPPESSLSTWRIFVSLRIQRFFMRITKILIRLNRWLRRCSFFVGLVAARSFLSVRTCLLFYCCVWWALFAIMIPTFGKTEVVILLVIPSLFEEKAGILW